MGITAVVIDSREPEWVQNLKFGGVPTTIAALDYGDLQVLCDDDTTLIIERKTSDDLLGSIADDRLMVQMAKCATAKYESQIFEKRLDPVWSYLVVTGTFHPSSSGKTVTERGVTGWNWNSVMGVLVSVQEMGVPVVFSPASASYEKTVMLLAARKRKPETQILPPKPPNILGPAHQIIASLPGIGVERLKTVMDYAGGQAGWALVGLTDPDQEYKGIPLSVNRRIRAAMRLKDDERLVIVNQ